MHSPGKSHAYYSANIVPLSGTQMDALTPLINTLNLHAKLIYSGGVCGQWLMDHHSSTSVWFHLVSKGKGWVHSPRWETPLALEQGDLILFLPHATRHFLSNSPTHLPSDVSGTRMTNLQKGDSGWVCGEMVVGLSISPLWRSLPAEIVIKRTQAGGILAQLIELIMTEAAVPRFGSDSVVERLFDSLFVLVIRHCIEKKQVNLGLFAALQDRRLATVLGLIHQQPWRPWTIADFCSRAGLSKTVLSEKFSNLMGVSPIEYLTSWRMQIAAVWLKEPNMTLERVAERCQYDSVPAFSKAFKRCFGITPGLFRRGLK
jgi:AraC-like DNA-binding protein